MLDIPIVRPSLRHFPFDCHPEIFSIDVNEYFIVVSFYQDAEVCIWDAVSFKLVNFTLNKNIFCFYLQFLFLTS